MSDRHQPGTLIGIVRNTQGASREGPQHTERTSSRNRQPVAHERSPGEFLL
jgi:hypothetical protein